MEQHTLQQSWNFWYAPRGRNSKVSRKNSDQYSEQLSHVGNFSTLEGFFSFYCYLQRPSQIPQNHKLILFRNGRHPIWENYPNGGAWIISFKKKDDRDLNKKWEQLLFACIGEQFSSTQIAGVVLSKRSKRNLLEVWIENAYDENIKVQIGEQLRKILQMDYQNLDQSLFKGMEKYAFQTSPISSPRASTKDNSRKVSLQANTLVAQPTHV